ncbi:MAG TPA: hypothetical protein VJI73_04150 [Candidatus Paceibacterota bacterium]
MFNSLAKTAYAQTYTLLEPLSGEVAGSNIGSGDYFRTAYNTALVLTVALSVVMIAVGGIQYSASAINPGLKNEARTRIWSAIGGLLLALFSWLILQTINPDILVKPEFL